MVVQRWFWEILAAVVFGDMGWAQGVCAWWLAVDSGGDSGAASSSTIP
ncbi:hypothetical protein TIFTF001_002136 [Ficus carica]|uniref:Uncharacterized protein n=1 Tax=Ficus carica TaxID=3494 RepID=A0AA87ZKP7_FICCA|nr:hypothetical protein TIFTF001_002136 [Ficus carica]